MKPKDVAKKAGCKVRNVQNWCKENGIKTVVEGMNITYDLTEEEIQQFMNRDTKRGRRWYRPSPEEEKDQG